MVILKGKLGVIGAGVMGRTLIKGILATKLVPRNRIWAAARTKESCQRVKSELAVDALTNYKSELAESEILVLCVKPSGMKPVLEQLKQWGLPKETLVISIVAGVSIEEIEETLGSKNPVIRAMPNTPCTVGQGMTAICAGSASNSSGRR